MVRVNSDNTTKKEPWPRGWWWGVSFPRKKRYEGVRFNVISVTRGWVALGIKFPGKSIT